MLHDLLVDIKLDKFTCYRHLETTAIEAACAEIEVAQLEEILKKYTSVDDMFTGSYLHGTNKGTDILSLSCGGLQSMVEEDREHGECSGDSCC